MTAELPQEKMTKPQKLSYGLGALGKDLAVAMVFIYIMFFATDVAGLSPAFVGTLFLFARLWDAVNDPVMGLIVDNTRTRFGKFRPWILIGTLVNAVVMIALFTVPGEQPSPVYFAIVYVIWGMTYTIMDIPFWSMIPTLSRDKAERERIAVIPRIFAALAWLLVGALGLAAVNALGQGDQAKGFQYLAIVIAVIFIVLELICVAKVREIVPPDPDAEKTSIKRMFMLIRRNDQLVALIGTVFAFNLVIQLFGGMALYYFTYAAGNQNLFSVFTAVGGVAQIIGLFAFPKLAHRIGRVRVYGLASALPIVGLAILFLTTIFDGFDLPLTAIAALVINLGVGLFLGISTVMLADVVDYGEFKFGTRNESVVFSVQPLLVKLASAFAGWFIGLGLAFIGYKANQTQSDTTILGMQVMMIGLPALGVITGYVVYRKYYKLNGEFQDKVLHSLAAERESISGFPV